MTDRLTKAFVATAMTNTNKALRDAAILTSNERLEMRDSGGAKFPIHLVIMSGDVHTGTIARDCNLAKCHAALETLRNLAHFAELRNRG